MSDEIHTGPSASWEDIARVRQEVIDRLRAELTVMTAKRDRLREALVDACERMERARGILRKPGEFGWAMLDTAALRAALKGE